MLWLAVTLPVFVLCVTVSRLRLRLRLRCSVGDQRALENRPHYSLRVGWP